jgi:hypothetical protein
LTKIFVIPDCQIRPKDDTKFLTAIGNYIVEKRPDVIVNLGDFADMPSLSSYDVGKKAFEGRRYTDDVAAVKEANRVLFAPLLELQIKQARNAKKVYRPYRVITLGNHEERINRAVNLDRKLEGLVSVNDLDYQRYYHQVLPFLEVRVIEGVAFSHYFTSGVLGRPATSAQAQLNKKHMSCVAGHQQGLQIATGYRADGGLITSVIAGSCYEHNEDYLGPQGNKHWRGCLMLHEVQNGSFDLMPVSLDYLKKKYI